MTPQIMLNQPLNQLNFANEKVAFEQLLRCCGASKWALRVMAARPFADESALFAAGEREFDRLNEIDWLEAFSHHPQLGDLESLKRKFAATSGWASGEQAGTAVASEAVLGEMARANLEYERKFGFIFILCATGKSAAEMLTELRIRIGNGREVEIENAAEQQKQITRLRLRKLLES